MLHISRTVFIHNAQIVALLRDSRSRQLKSLTWTDINVRDEQRMGVVRDFLSLQRVRSLGPSLLLCACAESTRMASADKLFPHYSAKKTG